MQKRAHLLELMEGQIRVEQQLALLGDELESCRSPGVGSPSGGGEEASRGGGVDREGAGSRGSVNSPGTRYNEKHEAIGLDCERLLAIHEQLRSYLEAMEQGDEHEAEAWLDPNHR